MCVCVCVLPMLSLVSLPSIRIVDCISEAPAQISSSLACHNGSIRVYVKENYRHKIDRYYTLNIELNVPVTSNGKVSRKIWDNKFKQNGDLLNGTMTTTYISILLPNSLFPAVISIVPTSASTYLPYPLKKISLSSSFSPRWYVVCN